VRNQYVGEHCGDCAGAVELCDCAAVVGAKAGLASATEQWGIIEAALPKR